METYMQVAQIIVALVLMVAVLAQSRGGGFTGGTQDQTTVFRTRRGVEKTLFNFTLLLSVVFVLISIASVLAARVV